jgi:lysophospholipase L1-like esterase
MKIISLLFIAVLFIACQMPVSLTNEQVRKMDDKYNRPADYGSWCDTDISKLTIMREVNNGGKRLGLAGDSRVEGWNGNPMYLNDPLHLAVPGTMLNFDVWDYGAGGTTSQGVYNKLSFILSQGYFDVFIVSTGYNDIAFHNITKLHDNLTVIVQKLKTCSDEVILTACPYMSTQADKSAAYGEDTFSQEWNKDMDDFNAVVWKVCNEQNINCIDLCTIMESKTQDHCLEYSYSYDAIHYSWDGFQCIANEYNKYK